ncbi:MAG: penicillin-binding protein 2, partial [Frankiaceae bacterium]|nr:penicillin-binding protein 2 [Frankiaceae bacterium]
VSPAIAQRIVEHLDEFPGLSVRPMPVRYYDAPAGANAAQLLGYLQPVTDKQLLKPAFAGYDARQLVGQSGLEAQYEHVLSGKPGVQTMKLDPARQITGEISATPPVPGDNVVLSIDAQVQALAEKTLANAVKADAAVPKYDSRGKPVGQSKANKAAAIVYDSQTGRIMALATYPNYDPNLWVGQISSQQYAALQSAPGQPLNNWAVSGEFPAGSTFKLVTTVGAIDDGLTSFSGGSYNCTPSEVVGGQVFHNYEGVGLGPLSLHDVIVHSCDTTYYQWAAAEWKADNNAVKAGQKPKETQQKVARQFGYGAATGVDVAGEAAGVIEDRAAKQADWAKNRAYYCMLATSKKQTAYQRAIAADHCAASGANYNPGDQANFNIGQGTVLVTPLQVATAYGALINGGKLYSPTLAWGVLGADGKPKRTITPKVRSTLNVSPAILDGIQSAMCEVPTKGTAASAYAGFDFSKVKVCGKTGTAQTTANRDDTSWFASFGGPVADPKRYVVVVVVPDGGLGAAAAAPATRTIWEGMFGLNGRTPMQFATKLPTFRPDGTRVNAAPYTKPVVPACGAPSSTATATATPTPTVTPTGTPTSTVCPTPGSSGSGGPTAGTTAGTTVTPGAGTGTGTAAAAALGVLAPVILRKRKRRRANRSTR